MKNEDRLIEVMAELLAEVHELRNDVKGVRDEVSGLRTDSNKRFDKLEKNLSKTNVQLAENTRALMKLADFNDRIIELEKAVFKKAG
ncbi:MAG: hypothetical protein GC178_02525 [Flavobacteriales bacterium]|nr:hypothetical protein [Flavobacteriales bacterium]